jgi:hypothetical protein
VRVANGGMNRQGRSDHGTMAERVAATRGDPRPAVPNPAPPTLQTSERAAAVERLKHCWVTGAHGRRPGLLLEWRRVAAGWQGRVVHPVPDDLGWILVEEWLPAAQLDQADGW